MHFFSFLSFRTPSNPCTRTRSTSPRSRRLLGHRTITVRFISHFPYSQFLAIPLILQKLYYRTPRFWRRHRRPLHPLLEHAHGAANAVGRHRVASVQSGLVQARVGAGEFWGRLILICAIQTSPLTVTPKGRGKSVTVSRCHSNHILL